MKLTKALLLSMIAATATFSQVKIGDSPTVIDDGSMLEIESTDKAFVPPRMTTSQMNAIPTPLVGALVFNTTENCLYQYRVPGSWKSLCPAITSANTVNITGTSRAFVGTSKIDVPGVSYTFTASTDGILVISAHGIALPKSNGNSSQGAFYLVVNGQEVDGAYYSTFDGQGLVSLGSHVALNYTTTVTAGQTYTIKVRVRRWAGNTDDQVNVNLSNYFGATASDQITGKTKMTVTFIPQ